MEDWRQSHSFDEMCPEGVPNYLHDLFRSNMSALLSIFSAINLANSHPHYHSHDLTEHFRLIGILVNFRRTRR